MMTQEEYVSDAVDLLKKLISTSMSENCGGGGSAPSSGWGKKDDEDDWKFAHRCAQMAHSMCKPKPRSRSFHR